MKTSTPIPKSRLGKINGKEILHGEGHIQPNINQWIGIFLVKKDLLNSEPEQWVSTIISYEGSFNCREKYVDGKSRGKIIHVRPGDKEDEFFINVEGTEEPQLEDELKPLRFSYNGNLGL